MSKAQNTFYVTHSSQITLIQLAYVTITFKMKTYNDNYFCNECWMLLVLCAYFFHEWNLMFFGIVNNNVIWWCVHTPSFKQICEVRNYEVYRHRWNFAKVEIFQMLKSIELQLVNVSSVKIHGCKRFYQ